MVWRATCFICKRKAVFDGKDLGDTMKLMEKSGWRWIKDKLHCHGCAKE